MNKKVKEDSYDVTEGTERTPDVAYRRQPKKIVDTIPGKNQWIFIDENGIKLRIRFLSGDIIRLTYFMEGDALDDFSYAVDPEFSFETPSIAYEEFDDRYELRTDTVLCKVDKEGMLVHFHDLDGNVLCEDQEGYFRQETLMKGIQEVKITKKAPPNKKFLGMGDKPFSQNLRGRTFENWNTDSYAYERNSDPLYRSIPFYFGLNEDRAYGIFLDNTYRTQFRFDPKKKNVSSFSAEGGLLDYYFINGPKLTTVAERYAQLTGTPELPPMWALGYHQCRWSYYPDKRVRELAQTFRELQIPCDAIYLDIDYMENYKVFTWNKELFANPRQLIRDLVSKGFRTIVMINPGILAEEGYYVYEEGKEKNYFCKRSDGEMFLGPVWPPRCAWPDFTQPEVRNWWADLYDEFMSGLKVNGIWNDMNEPAVFEVESKTFPEDIRHNYDGHPCSHRKAHNIYGMQMARASLKGIKKHVPEKRPFLLTRANFAGGQRYAALWTGDNIASWDHLKLANSQCIRMSISGYSFVGSDIGGFVERPSPELYARWLQLGIFHPLFRTHSMGYNVDGASAVKQEEVEKRQRNEELDQEPWSFGGKWTDINRRTIEFRYRLLPYLYSEFFKYVENGKPLLKPLAFVDQKDPETIQSEHEFMFGDHLLVRPVLKNRSRRQKIYLPEGEWYNFQNNECLKGKKHHTLDAPLEYIPLLVKAGSVIPLQEVLQYVGERTIEVLELNVYYKKGKLRTQFYEDAGEGYEYERGDYRLTYFTTTGQTTEYTLKAERQGKYHSGYTSVQIKFIGLPFKPSECKADGETIDFSVSKETENPVLKCTVSPGFERISIR